MRIAAWGTAAAGALILAFLAACGVANLLVDPSPWPLPRPDPDVPGRAFRVAVLGDAQKGLGNLANVLGAVRDAKADLILQTGDLVASNDEGHYRLVSSALRRSGLRLPLAVVPGNHDIKGDPSRFVRTAGPLEWSFRRGEVSFVIVNNAFGDPPAPERLEARMAQVPPGDAVVLAMHVPPFDARGNVNPSFEAFVRWLEKSRVRYLLCGQIHGYVRRRIGSTVVIANGVGGDYESWQLGQKVCLTILDVDGTSVSDRVIELAPDHGFVANFEHLAVGHVGEAWRARPWGGWLFAAAVAGLVGASVAFLRRPGIFSNP